MKKTAVLPGDYAQYAGYGQQGYHPGLDDPTQLPTQYYSEPKRYDQPPKWVGKTTAGLVGGALLLGLLGKGMGWRAARQSARRAKDVAALERRAQKAQSMLDAMPERMRQAMQSGRYTSDVAPAIAGTIKAGHVIVGLGRIARGGR
jgi:hypothetical protein